LVNDFLAKNNVTTLEHPPNSTDLAVADTYLYLFPRLKSALKGGCLDAADFNENAIEELKRLSQSYFQEFFQNFYRSWKKFRPIVAQGECFEGNVA
jgi:hypothetical protein